MWHTFFDDSGVRIRRSPLRKRKYTLQGNGLPRKGFPMVTTPACGLVRNDIVIELASTNFRATRYQASMSLRTVPQNGVAIRSPCVKSIVYRSLDLLEENVCVSEKLCFIVFHPF